MASTWAEGMSLSCSIMLCKLLHQLSLTLSNAYDFKYAIMVPAASSLPDSRLPNLVNHSCQLSIHRCIRITRVSCIKLCHSSHGPSHEINMGYGLYAT